MLPDPKLKKKHLNFQFYLFYMNLNKNTGKGNSGGIFTAGADIAK